jgi:hypothetical protein
VASDDDVRVRVDVRNVAQHRLGAVRVGGDLIGSHAEASLGDLEPGQTASGVLTFPYAFEWRPGRHVLPLSIRYAPADAPPKSSPTDVRAYLLLLLAAPAEPAVTVEAAEVTLDLRTQVPVALESTDGRARRVRVRVLTPGGLVAPDPPPVADVPAHGRVRLDVPLLYGAAPRGTPQGILIVAEALDGPWERMALATTTVTIAPDAARLPKLRAPLALASLVLLVAGLVAEWRSGRPRG